MEFLQTKEQEMVDQLEKGAIEAAMNLPPNPLESLEHKKKRLVAKAHQELNRSREVLSKGWKAILDMSREEKWDKLDNWIEWFQFKDLNVTDVMQEPDLEQQEAKLLEQMQLPHDYLKQMYHVGVVLYQKKRHEEAADVVSLCLLFNPNVYQLWFLLGLIQHEQQHYAKALLAYQSAIVCEDKNPYPYLNMAKAWMALNDQSEAEESLTAATELCQSETKYAPLVPVCKALQQHIHRQ